MYSLNTLHRINAQAAAEPKAETFATRHCSFCQQDDGAVVIHSAKQRSTGYLNPEAGRRFLAAWRGTNSGEQRDALVERYFSAIPTGKQQLVS